MSKKSEARVFLCDTDPLVDAALCFIKRYDCSHIAEAKPTPQDSALDFEWVDTGAVATSATKGDIFYMATVDDTPVGVIYGGADEDDALHYGHLMYLYVIPVYRRKGIGTVLVKQMERYFEAKGCRRVKIAVSPHEEHAIPFLRKQGYYHSYIAMKKRINCSETAWF